MNEEEIDLESVQEIAEEIYNTLLKNSATMDVSDSRLAEYSDFRNNLSKYDSTIEAQKWIEDEIELLYDLKSIDEFYDNKETEETEESKEVSIDDNKDINVGKWTSYWQTHLNSLKKCAQKLQAGGLDAELIQNMTKTIEDNERLYLSDLNDFERAWSLLFGSYPKHPYKVLLGFSFGFAFGIDLFSVLMSILLYLFRIKKPTHFQAV